MSSLSQAAPPGLDADKAAALKSIPVLAVFGDYFNVDARWATLRKTADLPQIGIRGNGHMLIMDRNNLEAAGLIQKWLAQQPRLYR